MQISVRLDTSGIPAHLNRILYVVNHPDESPLMEGVGGGAHLMSGNAPSKDDGNQSVIMVRSHCSHSAGETMVQKSVLSLRTVLKQTIDI